MKIVLTLTAAIEGGKKILRDNADRHSTFHGVLDERSRLSIRTLVQLAESNLKLIRRFASNEDLEDLT